MKRKMMALAAGLFGLVSAEAQTTQVVNLSTGVVNGSSTLSAVLSNDDTWTVKIPGGSTYGNAIVSNGDLVLNAGPTPYTTYTTAWDDNGCGRWISPHTLTTGAYAGYVPNQQGINGNYEYKMTFATTGCSVSSASILLNFAGADNSLTKVSVNGHDYTLSGITHNPLSTGVSVTINPAHINVGTNTVIFTAQNVSQTYTGLFLCGDLTINYANLASTATGPTTVCSGTAITFTGSDGAGTAANHYWELIEWDNVNNVPVSGGYVWSGWYAGSPGTFTFPGSASLACNKYYKVKLALQNACEVWVENWPNPVVYVACKPTPTISGNTDICDGSSTQLCCNYMPSSNATLLWNTPRNAGLQCITVSPSVNTTYTVTVTNQYGCSATASATVNVFDIDPSFNLYANTANTTHLELTATPNQTTGLPAGHGFVWTVEELDASFNPVYSVNSSNASLTPNGCWWTFPGGEVFDGFDGLTHTLNSSCLPSVGKFKYNTNYRITRGVWSTGCPWEQNSYLISYARSEDGVIITEDPNAPDFSYLMNQAQQAAGTVATLPALGKVEVYPNPGTGLFSIAVGDASEGKISIFDMTGRNISTIQLNGSVQYTLDLTGYAKGIYTVNVLSGNQNQSKKIVLE